MLLSVGIILHNNESNVGLLMTSLLNQTDRNFSLIVVDNKSSDASFNESNNFESDFRTQNISFTVLRNHENLGELAALNQLSKKCDTNFITIVHGDDHIGSKFVEYYNLLLTRDKNIVAANTKLRTENDGVITNIVLSPRWTGLLFIDKLLSYYGNPGLMPGSLFASRILEEISIPVGKKTLFFNADSLLWFRLLKRGSKVVRVYNSEYFYVRSNTQSSSSALNDEMMALARSIRISESTTKVQRYLTRSGVEFDRDFVDFPRYISSLYRMSPNFKVPKLTIFIRKIYSACSKISIIRN